MKFEYGMCTASLALRNKVYYILVYIFTSTSPYIHIYIVQVFFYFCIYLHVTRSLTSPELVLHEDNAKHYLKTNFKSKPSLKY